MTYPTALSIPADVMARRVGDETVLLHLGSGNYFGLDPVGSRFWELISQGLPLAGATQALLQEYEVSPEQLQRDLESLIKELLAQGLVIPA
jgi:hypothetical protein